MGLREVAVPGTPYTLVGMKDGSAMPNLEQRVEMAKRLNEVGPKLPRYVKHVDASKPEVSVDQAIKAAKQGELEMTKRKGAGALPAGIDPKEIEKAFHESNKESAKRDEAKRKAEAKKQKEAEAKRAAEAKARKKLKKADVTPKGPSKSSQKAAAKADGKKAPAKADGKAAAGKKAGGIGGMVCKLLVEGKENDAILAAVKKEFPKARTSAASIAWYRSKLREEGKLAKK